MVVRSKSILDTAEKLSSGCTPVAVFIFISLFCANLVYAGVFPGQDRLWLQVKSFSDRNDAIFEAKKYRQYFENPKVFLDETGLYAVVVSQVSPDRADKYLPLLKNNSLIPDDSFTASGETYLVEVWPKKTALGSINLQRSIALERTWSTTTRMGVQNALVWSGHYVGRLDGEFGPMTRRAIKNFQREIGELDTGYLEEHQIQILEAKHLAATQNVGFRVISDLESGIKIGMPLGIMAKGKIEPPFITYDSISRRYPATAGLISQKGGANQLSHLYDIFIDQVTKNSESYIVLKEDWFIISGNREGVSSYVFARSDGYSIKGFMLIWPKELTGVFGPLSVAMFNSFEELQGYVLNSRPSGETTYNQPRANSSLDRRRPSEGRQERRRKSRSTGTGFVVHGSGFVLTNAHVIDSCRALSINDRFKAKLIDLDADMDLAILRVYGGNWSAIARFSPRSARLNSDVTVVGYPLYGLLGGLNVTRGSISAEKGLLGDRMRFQITAAVQPGNSGGPVIDEYGAVVGVVEGKLDAGRVQELIGDIPQNVNFAIRGETVKLFMVKNDVRPQVSETRNPMHPADIAERAERYTVLVNCH